MRAAYYNENDPHASAWLRELIRDGLIAPGDVDERDIRDVVPAELVGYRQCHFFAGVGTWSYALRQAGWPDDRRCWTVSCPCQPISSAGRRKGFADERHLWPAWFHLAGQCRPGVVFGEQVESDDAKAWLDLVHTDMEALGYAIGPIVLPAAGFGAPEIRHRIWFVAESGGERRERGQGAAQGGQHDRPAPGREQGHDGVVGGGEIGPGPLADAERDGRGGGGPGTPGAEASGVQGAVGQRQRLRTDARSGRRPVVFKFDDDGPSIEQLRRQGFWTEEHDRVAAIIAEARQFNAERTPGPVNGFWANAEWLPCSDGKLRPAKPGTFPLVDGTSRRLVRGGDPGVAVDADASPEARSMRIKGYGNGIVAPAAEEVIRAYLSRA